MSAYVIGDINVTDPETFAKYASLVPASSGAFGCKYLVRGPDKCEPVEGDWNPKRFVLAEYKDVDTIKAWYYSEEYKELTKLRQSASTGSLLVANGVELSELGRDAGQPGYLVADIEVTDPDIYTDKYFVFNKEVPCRDLFQTQCYSYIDSKTNTPICQDQICLDFSVDEVVEKALELVK